MTENFDGETGTEKNQDNNALWDMYDQAWDPEKKIFGLKTVFCVCARVKI